MGCERAPKSFLRSYPRSSKIHLGELTILGHSSYLATCNRLFMMTAKSSSYVRAERRKAFRLISWINSSLVQIISTLVACFHVTREFVGLNRNSDYFSEYLYLLTLQKHGRGSYFCSTCSMEFSSAQEALTHRRSQEHRFVLIQRYGEKKRHCPHCDEVVNGRQQFKEHLLERHSEESHQ